MTKKDFPNQAGFTAHLVWDKTLVKDGYNAPQAMESDIDTANSVSSLKGQPVNITGFSMPQGETLPVSIWRNSVEVADSNPVPSSLIVNGLPAAPANPVPSSMQIGSQVVSPSNPVPSSMMVGGQFVTPANPMPSRPFVNGYPVSLVNPAPVVMMSGGQPISGENPLVVSSTAKKQVFIFQLGRVYSPDVFLALGASVSNDNEVYTCYPVSFFLNNVSGGFFFSCVRGLFCDKPTATTIRKYDQVYARIKFTVSPDTSELLNIRLEALGAPRDGTSFPWEYRNRYEECIIWEV